MAGTLNALLVVVCVTVLWGPGGVQGAFNTCPAMEQCQEDFEQNAKRIGHIREEYCRLKRVQVKCFHETYSTCPLDIQEYAKNRFLNGEKEMIKACDAPWIRASQWLLVVTAILAIVFHHCF